MGSQAEVQIAESTPPRKGAVIALTVDSTARPYDMTALDLGGLVPDADGKRRIDVILWMQAETNDVYFYFDSATSNVLDDTAKVAAAGALTYANTYGAVLKAGNAPIRVHLNRGLDKFLIVKAASTAGVLRMWAGSSAE